MLFPLPMTPFERYYLSDDIPAYPTTIPLELVFTGQLEQAPFTVAVRQSVERHPLLGALVDDGRSGPQWIACHQSDPWLDWADGSVPFSLAGGEYLDLRTQPGLRVWVRTSASESRVLLQVHHACCDGLAVFQFIGDLLALYAAAYEGGDSGPRLPDLPAERLRDRGVFDVGSEVRSTLAVGLRDAWVTVGVWRRILFRRCAVLAVPETRQGGPASIADTRVPVESECGPPARELLPFEAHVLSREESEQYKQAASSQGVTLNELMLRDMLLTIRDWNRAYGQRHTGRCQINVPVYVRGRGGAEIPASNGIGFGFLAVDPDRTDDRQASLRAVHRQMRQIKHRKLALYFLGGLAVATRFKHIVPWVLRRKKPLATMVLSYLGPVLARGPLQRRGDGKLICGNVVLEQVVGVPPVRPLTRASVAVMEYGGELAIGLRCDVHHFGPADTRALLSGYVDRVTETIRRQD